MVKGNPGVWSLISVDSGLSDGSHVKRKEVIYRDNVHQLEVFTIEEQMLNTDGECDEFTSRFKLKVLPQSVQVFC